MSKINLGLVEVMGTQDHRAMDLRQANTIPFTLATMPIRLKHTYFSLKKDYVVAPCKDKIQVHNSITYILFAYEFPFSGIGTMGSIHC